MPELPLVSPSGGRRGDRFGRSKRLPRGREFQRLLREGKSLRGDWLLLKALPNSRSESRFACSVRKTIARSAVARNRLKRWLRESFRRNQREIPAGFDWIAIIAAPGIKSYNTINKELTTLCNRLAQRF